MPNYSNNMRGFGNRSGNNRYVIPETCNCQNGNHQTENRSRCDRSRSADMPLAMAYIPWQKWQDIYDAEKALQRGTIFEELDMPFERRGGCRR